jgi:Domain of Unknown Function (DUF928)
MKTCKNLRHLSLILSGALLIGTTLPALGMLSSGKTGSTAETSKEILTARRRFNFSFQRRSARSSWRPGARRGACLAKKKEDVNVPAIIPLLPVDSELETNGEKTYYKSAWNTVSDHPTIFLMIPETNNKFTGQAEISLKNEKGEELYFAQLELPKQLKESKQPGIVSVTLPKNEKKVKWTGMKVNEENHWELSIICEDDDGQENPKAVGVIQKVEITPALSQQLDTSNPSDKPIVYGESGIVYESVSTLAALYQANPNDPELKQQWQELLTVMGQKDLVNVPLLGSATIKQEAQNYNDFINKYLANQ